MMRIAFNLRKSEIPNILVWFFLNVQFFFLYNLQIKIIGNLIVFSILMIKVASSHFTFQKRYLASLMFFTVFLFVHGAEDIGRWFNNLFFISIVYLAFYVDQHPVEHFLKSVLLSFALFSLTFLFNYKAILSLSGFGGIQNTLNINAVAVYFSGALLYVLCQSWDRVFFLRIFLLFLLIAVTLSYGAIIVALSMMGLFFLLKRRVISPNSVAFIFILLCVFTVTMIGYEFNRITEWTGHNYIYTSKVYGSFLQSKMIVFYDLFDSFRNGSFWNWLFGVSYMKRVGSSDYEYTVLIFELLYKYGLTGVLLYLGLVYIILRDLARLERGNELLVFFWSNMTFIFGAGFNAPSLYMVAFWLVFFTSGRRVLETSCDESYASSCRYA